METPSYKKKRNGNHKYPNYKEPPRRRIILSVTIRSFNRIKQYCQDNDYFISGWCSAIMEKHIAELEIKEQTK